MVNKVILIGNVGADPEVKFLDGGVAVTTVRLATSETYKNKNGEKVEQTEWHNVVLWRGLAEIAEKYIKKGMKLYIEGRLRTRSWDDQSGNKRFTTEIYADSMQILTWKQEGNSEFTANSGNYGKTNTVETSATSPINTEVNIQDDSDDDLPF
ncbi:MAG: single-stranded DNA-binding protein [Culturomica sp.]|jgi:single-strand DNA-binding protein|nr:single-stranded DNA-binding protein [Culturomica sp.]